MTPESDIRCHAADNLPSRLVRRVMWLNKIRRGNACAYAQ